MSAYSHIRQLWGSFDQLKIINQYAIKLSKNSNYEPRAYILILSYFTISL